MIPRIYGVVEIGSIILHLVVYAKIYRYKRQGLDAKPVNIFQNNPILKNTESQSLLGVGINIILIVVLTSTSFINVKISKMVEIINISTCNN